MIPYAEALLKVLDSVEEQLCKVEELSITDAFGRYLANPAYAQINLPAYSQSAMDGYAVKACDVDLEKKYRVSQRIAAGDMACSLDENTVARIFTGGMLPEGADTVIIQENAITEDKGGYVRFHDGIKQWNNVRKLGEECRQGDELLPAGRRLTAADLGLLVAAGNDCLNCIKPITVGFFSTGNELIEPGKPCTTGKIYNSNQFILRATLASLGVPCIDLGVCPDSPETTNEFLQSAAKQADCIISTGGMSVGEEDHVKAQVNRLGKMTMWKLAIKPGKPFAFGHVLDVPFFGLPGNPVSALVTFHLLVKPWLLKSMGADPTQKMIKVICNFERSNHGPRQEFARVLVYQGEDGLWYASLYPRQASSIISSLAFSNALLPIDSGQQVRPGDRISALILSPDQLF